MINSGNHKNHQHVVVSVFDVDVINVVVAFKLEVLQKPQRMNDVQDDFYAQ